MGEQGAFLAFEDDFGETDAVGIDDFAAALGEAPPLIFLSACRTAEQKAGSRPFAIELAAVVANLVGWDGSVYDRDAIHFAKIFYAEIALGRPVPLAAAMARRELLKSRDANRDTGAGLHWHLARVYLGPGGGGAMGRADGIAAVGDLCGQFPAWAGYAEPAIDVLRQAAAAYRKLGQVQKAQGIDERIAEIEAGKGRQAFSRERAGVDAANHPRPSPCLSPRRRGERERKAARSPPPRHLPCSAK
ncbi:MAG: hypothetical protein ACLPGW_09240 [Roseiarcus sp.]